MSGIWEFTFLVGDFSIIAICFNSAHGLVLKDCDKITHVAMQNKPPHLKKT